MLPVAQTAISVFGGSLDPIVTPGATASSLASPGSLSAGIGTGSNPIAGVGSSQISVAGVSEISDVAAPAPFADLLVETIGQVQSLEGKAKSTIEGLMSGKGVDVHEAMIAAQKAGMGFELVLSLRNKALSAYQQVMGMQF